MRPYSWLLPTLVLQLVACGSDPLDTLDRDGGGELSSPDAGAYEDGGGREPEPDGGTEPLVDGGHLTDGGGERPPDAGPFDDDGGGGDPTDAGQTVDGGETTPADAGAAVDAGAPDAGLPPADCGALGLVQAGRSSFCRANVRPFGGSALSTLAEGNGRWLQLMGVDLFSTEDGETWTQRTPGVHCHDVWHDGTQWLLSAEEGLFRSADGELWQSSSTEQFVSVRRAGGHWAAVHLDRGVFSSSDGVTWTQRISTQYFRPMTLAVSDTGTFVAGGVDPNNGRGSLRVSADGVTWTAAGLGTSDGKVRRVVSGGGLFVALAGNTGTQLYTSTDGVTWTPRRYESVLTDVAYHDGLWVAAAGSWLLVSTQGTQWSYKAEAKVSQVSGGDSGWLATGASGEVYASADGETWERKSPTPITTDDLTGVTAAAGQVMAVTETGQILSSPDGIAWELRAQAAGGLTDIAHGNGRWIAVGPSRTQALTSTDGLTWQPITPQLKDMTSVAYGNGLWVAVSGGYNGKYASSTDGLTWTEGSWGSSTVGFTGSLYAVRFAQGRFVAVGSSIVTTTDGVTWTAPVPTAEAAKVGFGGGRWVAVSRGDNYGHGPATTWTSADGLTWITATKPVARSVAWGNGTWFGLGPAFRSPDGLAWQPTGELGSVSLRDVTYTGTRWIAVGADGTILVTPGPSL